MDSPNVFLKPFKKLKNRLKGKNRRRDGRSETTREERETDVEESGASQRGSHLDSEVESAVESGPNREGNDVGGKKSDQVNPPTSTPSIPHSDSKKPDGGVDTSAVPDQVQETLHSNQSEQNAVDENKPTWKSTAYSTAKLLLLGVRESADTFGPLKSVAGGLCFILENCERTMANRQAIESLAPRVKALSESLCAPVSEGDANEQERRKTLEQKLEKVLRELGPLAEQGKLAGFFNNVKNTDKLGSLVEDIRETVMDYQTSLQRGIYDKSCQLIVSFAS
ncbi:hypothetical protein BDM02DRAFT_3189069 [Thelephora ganbajun]|uniref:Uncharacterized protein n=1 Tax=Thelephora ganbajun TaxID=370292 RepID=A0ACB6ZAM3_THEGA|nr:hypothetical protein BDM02DRAFT_3189069 [Thelephora ganbajun]